MKKFLLIISVCSFLMACGGNSANKEESDSSLSAENANAEIQVSDSVAKEMEKAKENIDKTTEELDQMLNDL